MTSQTRTGLTIPLEPPLRDLPNHVRALADLGYTDVWSSESDGADAMTPLVITAVSEPRLRLGTAILPVYTRGPACLAQTIASLADTASEPVCIGIGASSPAIVQRWNGIEYARPYQRVRDTLRFLRRALDGQKVATEFDTFAIDGFRLSRVPEHQPRLLLAALREQMLQLAGREADGVILNWLSASDIERVAEVVDEAAGGQPREVVARVLVCPSSNSLAVRSAARRLIAGYLSVPAYAAYHEWLGRGPLLQGMWEAWEKGDRKAAMTAVPDEVVDDLVIHGSPADCEAGLERYRRAGVTTVVMALPPFDPALDSWAALNRMGLR